MENQYHNKHNAYKRHPIHHGKFWDNEDHEIGSNFKRIDEDRWFVQQQKMLLWMANTSYGRELLCIPKEYEQIIEISKRHVTSYLGSEKIGKDSYLIWKKSDFRVGAKWANVIRYRWKEFQEYAQEYYIRNDKVFSRLPIMYPVVPYGMYAYTTSTFYPDPNVESTSVDGWTRNGTAGQTWADKQSGAGSAANDVNAGGDAFNLTTGSPDGNWDELQRAIYLFDSSAIPDTDTISAAVMSVATRDPNGKRDGLVVTPNANIYTTTPASNTALVSGDHVEYGTVAQATALSYASLSGVDTTYNDFTFNATGIGNISKTGVSKFGLRNANYDVANTEPSTTVTGDASAFDNYFADTAGTTVDPKLVVTHAAAATETLLRRRLLLGIGA